jgi:hypothetical protein
VTALNVAVGSESGELEMMADQDTVNRVVKDGVYTGGKVKVSVLALDKILEGRIPELIKIDVEGYEAEVLRGARNTLGNPKLEAVLMGLNGSGEAYGFDEDALSKYMIDLGFNICSYNALTRKLQIAKDMNWGTGNNLQVRNIKLAQKLLSSANRYDVIGIRL